MQNSLLANNVDHFSEDPAGTLRHPPVDAYPAGGVVAGAVGTTGAVTVTVEDPE